MAASPTPPPTTLALLMEPSPEPSRPRRRWVGRVLLVVVLVALGAGAVVLFESVDDSPPADRFERFTVADLDVEVGALPPVGAAVPQTREWADRLAAVTDIPARTLVAYLNAEAAIRGSQPDCKLSWVTLAGVGRVESHHGRYGGTRVGEDGQLSKPIIGVPLDGSPGVQAIQDTDGGRLDGDPRWDRAVGSMQFLPATWARWSQRANGDGRQADPQNVDDSALTAARYLCAMGGDLSTGPGWWKAVLTYNESKKYGRDVYSGADAYARKAAEIG
ncbi:murein transglycosylase [Actinokineospora sp. NBRC 105648]|uniref:murein transglycosylase n=1 Tax=Actinokineospora sp. NBRC 105648 TaxID=3032206 RepID=UPI0024A23AEC|nr:murein transglycosylase [Actinokineospora sp. NBRC 105648]GLZ39827.1 murein transglycosylase [Actinokineospora sp. NBRC 105648]